MYPLFETIRIMDGRPMHLLWHQERLNTAYRTYFGRECSFVLNNILRDIPGSAEFELKCRFAYNEEEYEVSMGPYMKREIQSLKLVYTDAIDYSLKYTIRDALNRLFEQREDCDEILIVHKGMISDTSFSNIVFSDGENWYTPSTPLLAGTQRSRLLAEGRLLEKRIAPADLNQFTRFKLINAMLDFDEVEALDVGMIKS